MVARGTKNYEFPAPLKNGMLIIKLKRDSNPSLFALFISLYANFGISIKCVDSLVKILNYLNYISPSFAKNSSSPNISPSPRFEVIVYSSS